MIPLLSCEKSYPWYQQVWSMNNLVYYGLLKTYSSVRSMDKLAQNDPMIDWESLRPIVKKPFRNDAGKGGRPHIDETILIRTLFLVFNCEFLRFIHHHFPLECLVDLSPISSTIRNISYNCSINNRCEFFTHNGVGCDHCIHSRLTG